MKLDEYCSKWRSTLNARKFRMPCFGRRNREKHPKEIRINNVGIEETDSHRFLGVLFSGDVSFSKHCSGIAQKVRKRTRVLRALAGTTWGACKDTLLRFYRSFVEPASTYGLVSWGVCAKDTHINKIKIARNEGLRTATGLPKSCKTSVLRNLTGTLPLRTIASHRTARLVDQALRLKHTPFATALENCVPCPASFAATPREVGMNFLAKKGLLAIDRNPFPQPSLPDSSEFNWKVKYTHTNKTDSPEQQRTAAYSLLSSLRKEYPNSIEVWTDGSLTRRPREWSNQIQPRERVAVLFTGGWYQGRINCQMHSSLRQKFFYRHGLYPSFQIDFDDKTFHAYNIRKINPDATDVIIDEDSTTKFQDMSRNVPEHIGGAGVLLKYPSNDLVEVAAPLSATSASYPAEVMASTIAFQKVIPRKTHITHILWATDSRSLLDALSGNITKASGITQHLWRTITTWLDKGKGLQPYGHRHIVRSARTNGQKS